MKSKSPSLWLVLSGVLVLPLLMTACGESSNLADPKVITSTTDCNELASSDSSVTCVKGYFVDDVVENLNYSCSKVNSVTDVAGGFSCPAGSKVEFSILNPDDTSSTAKKIILGSFTVKGLPAIYSQDSAIYVTPMDFGSQNAVNITRLLQTLREPDTVPDHMPSRRIKLRDADKKKLIYLDATVSDSSFALTDPVAFEGLFTSYFNKLSPTPTWITKPRAEAFLTKGIHSTVAGAYSVPGYLATFGFRPGNNAGDGDLGGIRGIGSTNYLLAATWNLVDRKGRITGFGVYTAGPKTAADSCKTMLPASTCSPMPALNVMKQQNAASAYWSPWDTTGSKWTLSYNLLDSTGGATTNDFSFTQGAVDRGAIAGSDYLYSRIYGENVSKDSVLLGRWRIVGAPAFGTSDDTSYTIARTRSVAPTLDPAYWGSVTFPLKVRMSFLKSDKASLIGVLRVLILEDGNVVSNLHDKCGNGLNMNTLAYPDGSKEFPLGTVAQIFSANNDSGKRRYMAPIMLIPDDVSFGDLRNIQIGISDGQTASVRLRVDTESSLAYLKIYSDTAFDSSGNARDQDTSAQWGNAVGIFKTLATGASGYITSQPDSGACI